MKSDFRLCQFLPTINRGDAMGGQAVAIHRTAQAAGVESHLFVLMEGNETSVLTHKFDEYKPQPNDVIVLNYGGRGPGEDWVAGLPGRVFIYYHNVTPARFLERIQFAWVEGLQRGRDTLSEISHLGGLAATEYNKQEMLRAGFQNVHVLPYFLDFDQFTQAAKTPAAQQVIETYRQPGVTNWLHVGRIVPNKRYEDIIRAFYIYHTRINPHSRLLLIGSSQHFEAYAKPIQQWIRNLGIHHAVMFTGQVGDRDQVAGFYKAADLYVCMSEHEGFCIPLLEAMVHQVPIIAFRSTGVTYTMGNAGVMVDDKDPRVIAHIAHLLCSNSAYREGIIAGQNIQAQAWHPDKARQALYEWLHTL